MHLSRLLSVMLVVGVAGGATIVACGGSSAPKKPDAKVFKDGPGSQQMDAPSGTNSLGKICTSGSSGDPSLCTTADPDCTSVGGPWFCTESCGFGPCAPGGTPGSANCLCNGSGCPNNGSNGAYPQPPSGGDAICMQQKAGNPGTPVCGLFGPAGSGASAGSAIAWDCAVLCGSAGSQNFGTCPSGLTCSNNFCQ